jgi:ABC-type sugar transport system ATPase subunit
MRCPVERSLSTSQSSEIHLIRINKQFRTGRKTRLSALNDVSLWVRRGQTVSVVGPTGCGKSTLLRVIAGLEQPDSGTVTFDGESVDALVPAQRGIGLVFQNYALYPHFKVRGNIAFYFRLRRWSAPAIDAKVQETSRVMGIGFDRLLGRLPRSLSGGEKQRVALARCLSHHPRVLLLDEPFSNLDAKLRLQTRTEVKRLIDHFGLTTLFVTHDQSEAVAMGHRIAVMQDGHLEQVGTFQELYEMPVSVFVAGFLGNPPMNLFPAQRHGDTVDITVNRTTVQVSPPPHLLRRVPADAPITIGVRPEHMQLQDAGDTPGLSGEVELIDVSLSDASQIAHLRNGETTFCAKLDLHPTLRPHQTLHMTLPVAHLHYFDQNGKRL